MTDLGELLRAAMGPGRQHGLVLARIPDGRFQASLERPQRGTFRVEIKADPVDALRAALDQFEPKPAAAPDIEDLL